MNEKIEYKLSFSAMNDFVPVKLSENGNLISYGGAQAWWTKQKNIKSIGDSCGCGVIVATNMIFYLVLCNKIELLDSRIPISKEYFMNIADKLWGHIKPYTGFDGLKLTVGRNPYEKQLKWFLGVTPGKLIKGFKTYLSDNGYETNFDKLSSLLSNKKEGRKFVKKNLANDFPVLLMSVRNDINEYRMHWIMITELEEHPENNKCFVTISTWGKRKEKIDFDKLWHSGFLFKYQYMLAISNIKNKR